MKEVIKFFQDMIKNPEGTYSTKRVMGWIVLAVTMKISLSMEPSLGLIGILLGAWATALGITSYDNKLFTSKNN